MFGLFRYHLHKDITPTNKHWSENNKSIFSWGVEYFAHCKVMMPPKVGKIFGLGIHTHKSGRQKITWLMYSALMKMSQHTHFIKNMCAAILKCNSTQLYIQSLSHISNNFLIEEKCFYPQDIFSSIYDFASCQISIKVRTGFNDKRILDPIFVMLNLDL